MPEIPFLRELSTLEIWLILQAALEAVLVLLMIVFLFKLRRVGGGASAQVPENVEQAMSRFITESEKLAARFDETLRQKKDLSISLLLKLERKINDVTRLLEQAETLSKSSQSKGGYETGDKANPAAPENRALVIRLAEQGLSVEDIARKARLHRGEVELILDLEKQLGS